MEQQECGEGKARDVKWCQAREEVLSLDVKGFLNIWTADLIHKADVALVHHRELVCLAEGGDSQLYAAGSVGHVALVDPRVPRVTSYVDTLDGARGVRSLQLRGGILSIGTGDGNLFLYDTRASRYLSTPLATPAKQAVRPWHPAPRYAPERHVNSAALAAAVGARVAESSGAAAAAPIGVAQGDTARPWVGLHPQGQRRLLVRRQPGSRPRSARSSGSGAVGSGGSGSGRDVSGTGTVRSSGGSIGSGMSGSEAGMRTTRSMSEAAAAEAAASSPENVAAVERRAEDAAVAAAEAAQPPLCLQTGTGWLDRGEVYWDNIHPEPVPNAIYAHAWDPTGTRLFVAGGPLAAGLQGSYMALWR